MESVSVRSAVSFLLVIYLIQLIQLSDACQLGDVRLAGGNSYLEGRVEYCKDGVWGTVCDDEFDVNDAGVTCRQLGFSGSGAQVRDRAYFGQGQGGIFLTDLECTGTEAGLGHCSYDHQCGHFEDVGVICNSGTNTQDVSLYFKGVKVPDHSLVSLETLMGADPLYCVTSKPSCCNSTATGNWYPPASASPLGFGPGAQLTLYQDRGDDQSVRLHATGSSATSGLYRCVIPDNNDVTQTLYVGVYPANGGSISSVELSYSQESATLTCNSTGGPATSVTWTKNGRVIQVDEQTMQQTQVVTDTASATYQSRLTMVQKESSLSGSYKCTVTNARGSMSSSTISVTVCKDGELRTRTSQGSATQQIELCSGNTWIQTESTLRVEASEEVIRNFAVKSTASVVELSWESDSSSISGFDVSCKDTRYTFISHLTPEARSTSFLALPASSNYECCVTALFERQLANTATYFHRSCLSKNEISGLPQKLSSQVEATLTYSLIAVIIILIVSVFGVALGCVFILISKRNYQKTHPRRNLVDIKTASNFLVDNPIYKTTGSVASLNSENGLLSNGNGHIGKSKSVMSRAETSNSSVSSQKQRNGTSVMSRTETSHSSVSSQHQRNGHMPADNSQALASNPKYGNVEHDKQQPRYVRVTSDSEPEYEMLPEGHRNNYSNSTLPGRISGDRGGGGHGDAGRSELDPIYSLPTALNRPPSHHSAKGEFKIPVYDNTTDVPATAGKDGEYAKLNHKS